MDTDSPLKKQIPLEIIPNSWEWERFLWIGHLKEDTSYCWFRRLPKELIKEISKHFIIEPKFFQELLNITPKKTKICEEHDLVWSRAGTLLILDSPQIKGSTKIAAFDLHGTIFANKPFGQNHNDWTYSEVPTILKQLHQEGYKIVLFAQSTVPSKLEEKAAKLQNDILELCNRLGFPFQAFVASAFDGVRKPHTTMWDYMVKNRNRGISIEKVRCFFVGDSAGRLVDWKPGAQRDLQCVDRHFGNNIGITFKTPEEYFLGEAPTERWESRRLDPKMFLASVKVQHRLRAVDLINTAQQELVVLVGLPASGKTHFALKYFVKGGYTYIHSDQENNSNKQYLQDLRDALAKGKSVIVDNTNPSASARKEYVYIADELGIHCRCFLLNTNLTDTNLAHHLNFYREVAEGVKRVSPVEFGEYYVNYEEPTTKEGFKEVRTIDWVPDFPNAKFKKLFLQRSA